MMSRTRDPNQQPAFNTSATRKYTWKQFVDGDKSELNRLSLISLHFQNMRRCCVVSLLRVFHKFFYLAKFKTNWKGLIMNCPHKICAEHINTHC